MRYLKIALLLAATLHGSVASAAIVVAGSTTLALNPIQNITLTPGSPFNNTGSNNDLGQVVAFGQITFDRAAQVGTSIELTNGVWTGSGSHPALGNFELIAGTAAGFSELSATLSNVMQDPAHPGFAAGSPDSITSGDIIFRVPNYGVRLANGTELEVRTPFFFQGTLNGLPPKSSVRVDANPFSGAGAELDIFIRGTNTKVGFTTERFMNVSAVPEPSSLAMLGGLIVAAGCQRRFPRNGDSRLK